MKLFENKGLRLLALVAVLALAITVTAAPVGASGDSGAVAAKKKCKKKKKKCKKPKQMVRATITWQNADADDADLDLFAFDANGNVAGKGTTAIPKSKISADIVGKNGSETFTDLAPKPLRNFSFGVCYQVGGSAHAPFTITYVTADGQKHTETRDPGSSFHYDFPGGAPIPSGYCPN